MSKKKAEPIDYSKFPYSDIYGEHAYVEKREECRCPECGIHDITYLKLHYDEGEYCYWTAKCANGHKFEEWYSMGFVESVKRFPDVPEEARTK